MLLWESILYRILGYIISPSNEGNSRKENANMNACAIDYAEKKIIITKSFSKAASKVGSNEYKELREAMIDHPTYQVIIRSIAKKKDKMTYRNLTYENMASYISTVEASPAAMLETFQSVKRNSLLKKGSYAYVKSWFLTVYPNYQSVDSIG